MPIQPVRLLTPICKSIEVFFLMLLFFMRLAFCQPQGGQVVSGNAAINQAGSAVTVINQLTNQVIINWQSFGINSNQLVQFVQPSTISAALNRVVGGNPSIILGALKANGNIFLINPNGILFGPTATVDVGGLLATTLSISDQDFLSGKYNFTQDLSHALSFVVNQGKIQAANGGYVVLLAPLVDNEGKIVANLGQVDLGGGTQAVVNFDGQGMVNLVLGNAGTVSSQNVVVAPGVLTQLVQQVVNDKDIIQAGSVIKQDGQVILGGASGTVINGGTIQANGQAGVQAGNILLDSTQATVLVPGSLTAANGNGENSSGGNIHILSEGNTVFAPQANLEAKGGTSGNGGFVEVSAKGNIWVDGKVDTSAQNGTMGNFLLDPTTLTIIDSAAGGGDQDSSLPSILYATPNTLNNQVSVGSLQAQTSNIILQATNSITINDLTAAPANGSITLKPNVSLEMDTQRADIAFLNAANSIVASGTGTITINAGTIPGSGGQAILGNLTTANQNIVVASDDNMTVGNLNAGVGNVSLSSNNGSINGNSGTSITASGLGFSAATGIGTAGTPINTNASNVVASTTTLNTASIYVTDTSSLTGLSLTTNNSTVSMTAPNISGSVAFAGGSGGTDLLNAQFTGSAMTDFVFSNTGGNIVLNATNLVNVGSYSYAVANLTASGNISNGASAGSITAPYEYLKAGTGIGASGSSIAANGANVTATTTNLNTAPIYLSDTSALSTLSLTTNNSTVSATAPNISGTLSFTSATDTLNAQFTGSSLTSFSFNNTGGNLVFNSSNLVTAGSNINATATLTASGNISNGASVGTLISPYLNLTAGTGIGTGVSNISTSGSSLSATTTGASAPIYVTTGSSLAAASATTNNSNASITAGNGSLTFTGGGTDTLVTNFPSTYVSFSNTGGSILNFGAGVNIVTNDLTLSASSGIGTSGQYLLTQTGDGNLSATTTAASAPIYLTESNPLMNLSVTTANSNATVNFNGLTQSLTFSAGVLNASASGTSVFMTNSSGNIAVGTVTSGQTVGLSAPSGTVTNNGGGSNINALISVITAGNGIGTVGSPLNTQSSMIFAGTTGTSAPIYITNNAATTLTNLSVDTNNSDVSITYGAGGSKSLTFTGATDVLTANTPSGTSLVFDNFGGNVVLSSFVAGSGSSDYAIITATGGTITGSGASPNLTATTAYLYGDQGIGTSGTPITTQISTLNASSGNNGIYVSNTGNLTLGSVTASGNTVTLTSTGNIEGSSGTNLTASTANLTAATDIGNSTTLNTAISTLNATAGAGNTKISNTGNLTLGSVIASGNTVTLTSTGNIEGSGGTNITAGTANLTAGTDLGNGATLNTAISTLIATASNGGIYVSNSGPGALTLNAITASGAGNNITISNSAGNIAVNGAESGGAVSLSTTNGSITDASASTVTGSTSVTLSATTGIGASGASVLTNTPSMTATTTTANTAPIYLADSTSLSSLSLTTNNSLVSATALNLSGTLSLSGGSGGTDLLNAVFTGSTLTSFSLNNTGGNIVLDSTHLVNLGSNAASAGTLTASGDIANGATTGSITANTLTLTAGTYIGTSGSNIATTISNLTSTATGGGIYVSNSGPGALTLNAVTAKGNGNTYYDARILNSAGNIAISGAVTGDNVTLTTTNGSITDASASTVTGNTSVTLNAITGIGTSVNNLIVNTPGITAITTTANTASIYITDNDKGSGALANLSITTNNSTVSLTSGYGSLSFAGGSGGSDLLNVAYTRNVQPLSTFSFNNTGGSIVFDASDIINLVKSPTATLTASGSITSRASSPTNITAGSLALSAATGIGTSTNPITTAVGTLNARNTTSGNIYLSNTGSLTLNNFAGLNNNIAVLNGSLTGIISLASTGSINHGTTATDIQGYELFLSTASGMGSSLSPLATVVSELTAYNSTSGGIYISNSGTLSIDDYSFGQGFGIENKASGGISITNSGTINIPLTLATSGGHCLGMDCTQGLITPSGVGLYAPNGGNITLTATGGTSDIVAGAGNYGELAESDGGSISITAGHDIDVGAPPSNWADIYTYRGTGTITVNAGNNLNINGWTYVQTNSGNLNLQAGNNITIDSTSYVFSGNRFGTVNGSATISLTAGNSANIDNIYTFGNVNVTATSGKITDSSGGANTDIYANTLTLTAGSGVGTDQGAGDPAFTYPVPADDHPLYTTVTNVNATVSSGGIVLVNSGNLTIGTWIITGDTDVAANGSVRFDGITSTGDIEIVATGDILDITNGTQVDLTGTAITLISGGTIGAPGSPLIVNSSGPISVSAGGAQNGVSINISNVAESLNLLDVLSSPGMVIFNGNALQWQEPDYASLSQSSLYLFNVTTSLSDMSTPLDLVLLEPAGLDYSAGDWFVSPDWFEKNYPCRAIDKTRCLR